MIALANGVTVVRKETAPVQVRAFVLFTVADELYALPVSAVHEVLRPVPVTPWPQAPAFVDGVISVRKRVIAVVDLQRRLAVPGTKVAGTGRILVVRVGPMPVGLVTDGVQEVVQLNPATIQPPPPLSEAGVPRQYFAGVARVKERLVLVVNLAALFNAEETKELESSSWPKS